MVVGLQRIRVAVNHTTPHPWWVYPVCEGRLRYKTGREKFLTQKFMVAVSKAGFEVLGEIRGSEAFAANLARRIVWLGWGVFNGCFETLHALFKSRAPR